MMDEQYLLLEREMHKFGRGIWLVAVSRHWVLSCRRMTHRLDASPSGIRTARFASHPFVSCIFTDTDADISIQLVPDNGSYYVYVPWDRLGASYLLSFRFFCDGLLRDT